MPAGLELVDWLGLVVPFALYFVLLWIWYIWEGKRERRLNEQFEEAGNG